MLRIARLACPVALLAATTVLFGCGGSGHAGPSKSPRNPAKRGPYTVVAGNGQSDKSPDSGRYIPIRNGQDSTDVSLGDPLGLAAGPDGSLFVSDGDRCTVYKIDAEGKIRSYVKAGDVFPRPGVKPTDYERLGCPGALASDHRGDLFIGDDHREAVREVTASGHKVTVAGANPKHVDAAHGRSDLRKGDGNAATDVRLGWPANLAVTSNGNAVYVGASKGETSQVLRVFSPGGKIRTIAGRQGLHGSTPVIDAPTPSTRVNLALDQISLDGDGDILISASDQILRIHNKSVTPTKFSRTGKNKSLPASGTLGAVTALGNGDLLVPARYGLYLLTKDHQVKTLANGKLSGCQGYEHDPKATQVSSIVVQNGHAILANTACRQVLSLQLGS